MTPAVSTSFFDADFSNFLYAPIGCESNGMALSVLSAFARLNVDPWREAAELSELSKDDARKRLATLVARLPVGGWAAKDCGPIADRLIQLLPCRDSPTISRTEHRRDAAKKAQWAIPMLIAAALTVAALITVASRALSSNVDRDMLVFTTSSPQSQ